MKIPLSWISSYTNIIPLLEEKKAKPLAHSYSIHTAEIDGIEEVGMEEKVVIAKVIATKPHPDSDHLNLVELEVWVHGKKNIVCGAENVRTAKYVPLAMIGAKLGIERDFEIKLSKIRWEVSEGMICSMDELGLTEERASGIMELEQYFETELLESKLGTPFFSLEVTIPGNGSSTYSFPLKDTVFEIDNKFITNRPDLFSVEGNAREFGAVFSLPFTPFTGGIESEKKEISVQIDSENVLSYSLIEVNNISVAPSPLGIDQMLRKSGITPKYDLVDITNYIMTELGQPIHAFDKEKVDGKIIVRQARAGELLLALDGKEYSLSPDDLVIADESKVLAIAGVIGGMSSAISETTKNVYFESACFDSVSIRLTSQRLAIRTDASMRFEKSIDPLLAKRVLPRVFDLLNFLKKGGDFTGSFNYINSPRIRNINISTDLDFIEKKLGLRISKERTDDILQRLGFTVQWEKDSFSVQVPSYRASKDINIKEDIVEEIGRINGYENVPNTPILGPFSIATKNASIELRNSINQYFSSQGLYEAYNYSFSNQEKDAIFGYINDTNAIHIKNAFNVEYTMMRRSLAPNLFSIAKENLKQSKKFWFFEIGKIFEKKEENIFSENKSIAGILIGNDMTTLRIMLDGFFRSIIPGISYNIEQGSDSKIFHPNKSGRYTIQGEVIVNFWFAHPAVAESFDLSEVSTLFFEIDYTKLVWVFEASKNSFEPIARYPGIRRELNFVFDETTPVAEIIVRIQSNSKLLSDFSVVDTFRDAVKVGEGKKSVTFSFLIQDTSKTITDEEALIIQEKIIRNLEWEGIFLRK